MTDIDSLAYRFWSIHPCDLPEPVGMPEGYKGGIRAWFYATEMRKLAAEVTRLREAGKEAALQVLASDGQAAEALDRALAAEARVKELEGALQGVWQYGSDTLAGPSGGVQDDREWQREGVVVMVDRARAALGIAEDDQ